MGSSVAPIYCTFGSLRGVQSLAVILSNTTFPTGNRFQALKQNWRKPSLTLRSACGREAIERRSRTPGLVRRFGPQHTICFAGLYSSAAGSVKIDRREPPRQSVRQRQMRIIHGSALKLRRDGAGTGVSSIWLRLALPSNTYLEKVYNRKRLHSALGLSSTGHFGTFPATIGDTNCIRPAALKANCAMSF